MIGQPAQRFPIVCLLALALIVGTLGVVHVYVRHDAILLGYEFSRVTDELRKQREEHRRLLLEKAVLTAPDRIETLAKKIGLKRATEIQIRAAVIDPNQFDSQLAEGHGGQK